MSLIMRFIIESSFSYILRVYIFNCLVTRRERKGGRQAGRYTERARRVFYAFVIVFLRLRCVVHEPVLVV